MHDQLLKAGSEDSVTSMAGLEEGTEKLCNFTFFVNNADTGCKFHSNSTQLPVS